MSNTERTLFSLVNTQKREFSKRNEIELTSDLVLTFKHFCWNYKGSVPADRTNMRPCSEQQHTPFQRSFASTSARWPGVQLRFSVGKGHWKPSHSCRSCRQDTVPKDDPEISEGPSQQEDRTQGGSTNHSLSKKRKEEAGKRQLHSPSPKEPQSDQNQPQVHEAFRYTPEAGDVLSAWTDHA